MREFIASERCDRCGAPALHAANKPGCSELLFCNHHHREFKDALLDSGWEIESSISYTANQHTNRNETNEVR